MPIHLDRALAMTTAAHALVAEASAAHPERRPELAAAISYVDVAHAALRGLGATPGAVPAAAVSGRDALDPLRGARTLLTGALAQLADAPLPPDSLAAPVADLNAALRSLP